MKLAGNLFRPATASVALPVSARESTSTCAGPVCPSAAEHSSSALVTSSRCADLRLLIRPGVWVREPVTYPAAHALASPLCALWGRHKGAPGSVPFARVCGVQG